ncbi:16S rRNA (cytidine(1402)-2'-O)-methyltransferase [bacterium]|nr:16S rRNA (cytidine(1402)-2'-O)-methyltransferase [bacterium]
MEYGKLKIIGTPIGNLNDVSDLMIKNIKECDILFCEDTRKTMKLFNKFNIKGIELKTLRDDNEHLKVKKVITLLESGSTIGIVSDAGMPLISDPGYKIVRECERIGIMIDVFHGPTAVLDALIKSGLPTDNFWFIGFFPAKKKKRSEILDIISEYPITLIFYESPFRIKKILKYLKEKLKKMDIAVCRELTKIHETIIHTELEKLEINDIIDKGEFVVILRRHK